MSVVLQRNIGIYATEPNPLNCGDPPTSPSGLLASGTTGGFDGSLADVVLPEDTIDTRFMVSLTGWGDRRWTAPSGTVRKTSIPNSVSLAAAAGTPNAKACTN